MKQTIMAFCLLLGVCAFSEALDGQTSFTVTVEPADAVIKVLSGSGLKEQVYRSPAEVRASVSEDPRRAKQNILEVSRDGYRQITIPLGSIRTGEVLKLRLQKIQHKQLKFRMVSPTESDNLRIRDGQVSIALTLDEKQMQMSFTNTTPLPIRVLWQRAAYTDAAGQNHRIMHPGIRYEERNRSFPYQTVMPYMTIHQPLLPVDMVTFDRRKQSCETLPLFPADAVERFKGRIFELLIPVEIENRVVPYTFKVKVLGMVGE